MIQSRTSHVRVSSIQARTAGFVSKSASMQVGSPQKARMSPRPALPAYPFRGNRAQPHGYISCFHPPRRMERCHCSQRTNIREPDSISMELRLEWLGDCCRHVFRKGPHIFGKGPSMQKYPTRFTLRIPTHLHRFQAICSSPKAKRSEALREEQETKKGFRCAL